MKKALVLLLFLAASSMAFAEKTDSISTKVKNGKVYILHKVEKGQGLYSISRRYGVSLQELIAENPGSEEVIRIDQIIWVPTDQPVVLEEKVVEDFFDKTEKPFTPEKQEDSNDKEVTTFAKYHRVEKGETLFGIARMYNTSVESIQSLNEMDGTSIVEGQRLLVPGNGQPGELTIEVDSDIDADFEEIKRQLNVKAPQPDETGVVTIESGTSGYSIKIQKLEEYNLEKIEEKGTIKVGDENIQKEKNFAYHCSAAIGTVIMITNPENNKTLFVKVVGNFERAPDSSEIIRISNYSAQNIGIKSKAPVQLSYAR